VASLDWVYSLRLIWFYDLGVKPLPISDVR